VFCRNIFFLKNPDAFFSFAPTARGNPPFAMTMYYLQRTSAKSRLPPCPDGKLVAHVGDIISRETGSLQSIKKKN
jgi:hypothetical protein